VTIEKLPNEIKRALFIRIDRIGDLVLSTPALKAFKHYFPDCELSVLASKSNRPVLLNLPYVDNIINYDHDLNISKKISTLRRLRKYNYDLVIDPYSDYELKTALIAAYSGAPIRLGYASYGREVFFNMIATSPENDQPFKDVVLNVFKPLGVEKATSIPEIHLSEAEKEWSLKWIERNQIGPKPMVGIHPGAYYESQRWLPEYFSDLINKIEEQKKFAAILFHGPEDIYLVKAIKKMIKKNIPTFTSHDLRKFLSLQSLCNVFICNNSGPLHLAVAQKIKTISFMGPTEKFRWMPIGSAHKVLRIDSLPCIGCKKEYCRIKTHDCMRLIKPAKVVRELKKMMGLRNVVTGRKRDKFSVQV
jgi:lipopolysaccharide heptosyltransferase II